VSAGCEIAGFVLAGGQSSRMGRDKALVQFAGLPLIENALGILRQAGLVPQIAGARSDLARFAPVVSDREPGLGPLSGICAALESTQATHAVFLPVDQPLIPASLVAYLLFHARITGHAVTLLSLCGAMQTFPAVLSRAALPTLLAELSTGRRACWRAFRAAGAAVVPVELLAQAGHVASQAAGLGWLPPCRWFLNVNTPGDLERIQRIARIAQTPASIP